MFDDRNILEGPLDFSNASRDNVYNICMGRSRVMIE